MRETDYRSKEIEQYTPLKTAIIGAGNISSQYIRYLQASAAVEIVSCADRIPELARVRAHGFGINASSTDEVLEDPTISLVINITNPASHGEVTEVALRAGKHIYIEKPLATIFADGQHLVAVASEVGRRLGCAPDTFLTPDIQEARRRIDAAEIGEVKRVFGRFSGNGPEKWHPNPAPFYAQGAGPVFNMGPYYLTTLAFLLGPVTEVEAVGERLQNDRPFPVEVPTDVVSHLKFGEIPATVTFSFDGVVNPLGLHLEIIGTDGAIGLSDPNSYQNNLFYLSSHPDSQLKMLRYERGMGAEEFAMAVQKGNTSRMDAQLGLHVLEVMEVIHCSVETREKQKK